MHNTEDATASNGRSKMRWIGCCRDCRTKRGLLWCDADMDFSGESSWVRGWPTNLPGWRQLLEWANRRAILPWRVLTTARSPGIRNLWIAYCNNEQTPHGIPRLDHWRCKGSDVLGTDLMSPRTFGTLFHVLALLIAKHQNSELFKLYALSEASWTPLSLKLHSVNECLAWYITWLHKQLWYICWAAPSYIQELLVLVGTHLGCQSLHTSGCPGRSTSPWLPHALSCTGAGASLWNSLPAFCLVTGSS